jgi:polysaccharide deacetylase 2 family uncharacterized protein YibQ
LQKLRSMFGERIDPGEGQDLETVILSEHTGEVMGKKRRSNSRRGTKKRPRRLAVGLLAGVLALFIGFALWQAWVPKKAIPRPPYEEPIRFATEISRMVWRADNAIYRSVREGNINRSTGLAVSVRPTNQHGVDLDFSEVTVTAADHEHLLSVQRTVCQRLAQMGKAVRLEREATPDGGLTVHVYLRDFYTHRIAFVPGAGQRPVKKRPQVAIIIDDLGYDRRLASEFFGLDVPLTLSVLPSAPFAKEIANEARTKGFELLLHMPMEPKNHDGTNPGPVVLTTDMNEERIRGILSKCLAKIPGARGVNNHMGSLFTEDLKKMTVFLSELKKKGLFFVDSRTSPDTIGRTLARQMGVPSVERNVFLDHDLQLEALRGQMDRLLGLSRTLGSGVGIGHPHRETLELLREYLPKLRREYEIVPVSALTG